MTQVCTKLDLELYSLKCESRGEAIHVRLNSICLDVIAENQPGMEEAVYNNSHTSWKRIPS